MTLQNAMTFTGADTFDLRGMIVPGIVVNNNDPMQLCRVTARASLLHQGIQDEQLPWILPFLKNSQGSNSGIGEVNVPCIGTPIGIFFPENDAINTYYIGNTKSMAGVLPDFAINYPFAYGHVDSAGNLFKVDTIAKTWIWNFVDGSLIEFSNGTCNIVATKTMNVNIQGPCNINVQGNCSINTEGSCTVAASGELNLFGSTINLNSGSPPPPSSPVQPMPRQTPPTPSFSGQVNY
jgi:Type VI secretion system/phage-baseplate injector OB domain